ELTGLDERSPVLPLVTSTRENCLGTQCPRFRACHVNLARREALAADVVVINHHLFFADLAVRESGMAELLPTVRVAIFDEAHQLNETGVQFLGAQLGTSQLLDFSRDMLAAGLQLARGLVDWQQVASGTERAARELRLVIGRSATGRLRWAGDAPDGIDPHAWQDALEATRVACEQAAEAIATVSEIAPDFQRLHERAVTLAERAARFTEACDSGSVRWVDVGQQLRLMESPLDIAQTVRTRLLKRKDNPVPSPQDDDGRAWIFTSATLGDDARLSWFTEPCGLQDAQVLRVGSPFDYPSQASLYLPRELPKPNDPGHSEAVARLAAGAALRIGGRTMVLTTTLRALRAIGEDLLRRFGDGSRLEVLVQGQWPKRRLIERFREGDSHGRPGCLLVASASFWEGVDVPGDALQLVVIDKLPFPPPGDPVVEARSQRLEGQGRSSFNDYFIPEAAVALKQGAGRLIRRESDRGVLVVCDTRMASMGYGRRLIAALPPMRRLSSPAEFEAALDALRSDVTSEP
ncbi:MAG TPA: ATP-dependent DNA helicase, partial [Ramlibacter sp.]